jgi:phenylacetate-CoA ligase
MGPGVASEGVEAKDGPVVWEDHFYPGIIDPVTGASLADGEFGELVLTSLSKEALPIVRYRTRDLTRLLPPTARSMRRIARIVGRSDDMLIIRGVNLFPSQVEEMILAMPALGPHYLLEVSRDGPLDALTIRVECVRGADLTAVRCDIERELTQKVKAYIGLSVTVRVGPSGSIERSTGKARRVLDRRELK